MERQLTSLKFLTFFGWTTGTLILHAPWPHGGNGYYGFSWMSFSTGFYLLSLSYVMAIKLDLFTHNGLKFFDLPEDDQPHKDKVAASLMSIVVLVSPLLNMIVIRLNGLYYGREIANLLNDIRDLGISAGLTLKSENMEKAFAKRGSIFFPCLLPVTVAAIFFDQFSGYRIREKHLCHLSNHTVIVPNCSRATTIAVVVSDFFMVSTVSFLVVFFIVVGLELMQLLNYFGALLESLWEKRKFQEESAAGLAIAASSTSPAFEVMVAVKWFDQLRNCVTRYNKVCGMSLFILIVTYTLDIAAQTYDLGLAWMSFGAVAGVVFLFTVTNFGQYLESQVEKIKDNVRRLMVLKDEQECNCSRQLTLLTNWFLDWRFQMTAKNIFILNHSLIPLIMSTALTYVIFIFQIRKDEF